MFGVCFRVLRDVYANMMSNNQDDASSEESSTDLADCDGPVSDDQHPVVVKFEEVSAAAFKIRGGIERTPCNVSFADDV